MLIMRKLFNWIRDVSISRKLYVAIGTMAGLIGVELFVLWFSLSALSSLRAYVGGEGLWSKAEKDAVFHLHIYGFSHNESDYQLFRQFMQVPLGDAKARAEMVKSIPQMDAARAGFLAGRNHPDDIDGMIGLFINYGRTYYITRAIEIWGEAQGMALQLLPVADQLHDEITSSAPSQQRINELLSAVYTINAKVTRFEDEFSFTLGAGSRWLEHTVLRLLFATAITVETTGVLLAFSITRGIHKGLTNIILAANRFSGGDLNARADVLSRNEIGVVAGAFNEMANHLQVQMKELAQAAAALRISEARLQQKNGDLEHKNGDLEDIVADRTRELQQAILALQNEAVERYRVESDLQQSQRLQALGQLTGGVAHEFNNMLQMIGGNLELMRRSHAGRHIEAAQQGVIRAAALTQRLLSFARRQTLQPREVSPNDLIIGIENAIRRVTDPAIMVERRIRDGVGVVRCDPHQLESALLNLTNNARDAIVSEGRIIIGTDEVVMSDAEVADQPDAKSGTYVQIFVIDTGRGMDAFTQSRAFEPFFTTKPVGQGTGLGLSQVYGFAQQSGGFARLKSMPGQGTTVRLYLPRHKPCELAAVPVPSNGEPAATGTVTMLLVDDEKGVHNLLS
jgi:signal transduction histidine kinase